MQCSTAGVDTGAGISANKKACLQLLDPCMFVGCRKDSACFQNALPSVLVVYERQVLSLESDVFKVEEAVEASKVFITERAALALMGTVDSWTVLPGTVPVKKLHAQIMHVHGNKQKYFKLIGERQHIPLPQWYDKRSGHFNSTYLETLLVLHQSPQGITVKSQRLLILMVG